MSFNKSSRKINGSKVRILHRYLGFFLVGIMFIYAFSGIVLIYRKTNFFKVETLLERKFNPNISEEKLGKLLRIQDFQVSHQSGDTLFFAEGYADMKNGKATYKGQDLPLVLKKFIKLHKSNSGQPIHLLNAFFGVSLIFFSLSSIWMFRPKTRIYKEGIKIILLGIAFALILIFLE